MTELEYWKALAAAAIEVINNFTLMNSHLPGDMKTKKENEERMRKYLELKNKKP